MTTAKNISKALGNKIALHSGIVRQILTKKHIQDSIGSDLELLRNILNSSDIAASVISSSPLCEELMTQEENIEKFIKNEHCLNKIIENDKVLNKIIENDKVLNKIIENPTLINKIVMNDESMKQVMLSKDFGLKARFNEAMYRTKTLQYELPAFVVSYPRSGSNFLQSVLSASCGIHSRSIYGKYNIWPLCKPLTDPQSVILSLKSHALSPEYLQDEINRFLPHIKKPSKIILLKRDPRDVMISFYEYTQYKREAKIPQEDFLENVAFFYASTIDSKFKRRLEYAPLSICDAYKKHVNSWFGELPKDLDLFTVAFEELRENPEESFGSIFEFLNLDCKLAEESLNKQVSVYSKENRPRGKSFGWRDQQDKYKTIIDDTNRLLEKEIRMLGYEL